MLPEFMRAGSLWFLAAGNIGLVVYAFRGARDDDADSVERRPVTRQRQRSDNANENRERRQTGRHIP